MENFTQVVDWSRAQFALTAMYHWLFVPLTLGLSFMIAFMETKYYRTGDEFWKRTTKFWMKLFGVNFAVGVATGLILEFEFGTNWSNYSYFVGDIFGAPLAIEGIMAFFMESTFIAVMFFGWNKVSKGFHLASTWLTAFGASLSALWILVANAWMQSPVGMEFNPITARNEMASFWEVLLSPVALNKFTHTVSSGFVLAAVFVVGVSAWFLLKNREIKMARQSIKIAAIFGVFSSLAVIYTGDGSAVQVARVQPMKLAAMEGLYTGTTNAGLVGIGVLKEHETPTAREDGDFHFRLEIPSMLSILSYRDADAFVAGIDDLVKGNPEYGILSTEEKMERGKIAIATFAELQAAHKNGQKAEADSLLALFRSPEFKRDYFSYFGYGYFKNPHEVVPNVPLTFYSFRIMVILGTWFILLFAVWWWIIRREEKKPETENRINRLWLHISVWSIALAYIASQAGWVVAEVGRQPWTIQDLLPTVAAVSRIEAGAVMGTFWLFAALFTTLLAAEVTIMIKQIKKGGE